MSELTLVAVHRLRREDSGIGSGVLNTMQQVGGALGLATLSTVALHFSQDRAGELAPGTRVNAVAPAVVRTRFASALYEGREEEASAAYPLGRLGEPDDIANAIAFFTGEAAGFVSGQVLYVAGGPLD